MPRFVVDTFENYRSNLIGLAYRITGSAFEAEDIVHEVFIRWYEADHQTIKSPYSWLVTVTSRLSLDYLKSAMVQRQTSPESWLPEPFIEENDNPDRRYEIDESVAMALLLLFEKLSPAERATYILHDIFQFSFDEISNIVDKTSLNCRKLASRARAKIDTNRCSGSRDLSGYSDVVSAFLKAMKSGDLSSLVLLLQNNINLRMDCAGSFDFRSSESSSAEDVVKMIADTISSNTIHLNGHIEEVWFNGTPGLLLSISGQPYSAFNFEVVDKKIRSIHVVCNPDKLRSFCEGVEVEIGSCH